MAKRLTRLGFPLQRDSWLQRTQQAVSELQAEVEAASLGGRWALLRLEANQTSVSNNGLVAFNTVVLKRGDIAASPTGVITLPAGYWKLSAWLLTTASAAIDSQCAWYSDPAGDNVEIPAQRRGYQVSATISSNNGGAPPAVAFIQSDGRKTVGLRFLQSSGTATISLTWTRAEVEEVDPWD